MHKFSKMQRFGRRYSESWQELRLHFFKMGYTVFV